MLEKGPIEDDPFGDGEDFFCLGVTEDSGYAQKVAGVIQSRLFTRPGTAFLARLFSANTGPIRDLAVTEGMSWVLDRRVDITNLSWGGPLVGSGRDTRFAPDGEMHYLDRSFDYQARYDWQSFASAAGNLHGDFVHSPASAWNVIAVGVTSSPAPIPIPRRASRRIPLKFVDFRLHRDLSVA